MPLTWYSGDVTMPMTVMVVIGVVNGVDVAMPMTVAVVIDNLNGVDVAGQASPITRNPQP